MSLPDQDNCFQPHFTHSLLCAVRTVRLVCRSLPSLQQLPGNVSELVKIGAVKALLKCVK